jgi:carbonic anhydrase/acetyltransferase-like protein (isoleucine patch superfamily)
MTGPLLLPYDGRRPRVHASAWIAPGATLVGDVEVGAESSIWYGCVLRGDVHRIRIGARTNLQDGCVVHVTAGRFAAEIGDEVTVGHRAVVHGCRVGDGALIGIGAVVLDGAEIGSGALVAAGALVAPGARVEPGMLVLGAPARAVRELSSAERAEQRERTLRYVETAKAHARAQAAGG